MTKDTMTQAEREASPGFAEGEGEHEEAAKANGRSIAEIAKEDGPEDEEGQQLLDIGGHVNLSLRGRKPTDSQLKIKAVSRDISGQLGDKGDDEMLTVVVRARVDKTEFVNKRDGDGRVIAKIRRHVLEPISMTAVTDEALLDQVEEIVVQSPTV